MKNRHIKKYIKRISTDQLWTLVRHTKDKQIHFHGINELNKRGEISDYHRIS